MSEAYGDFVTCLCKDGRDVIAELTPQQAHGWHMATGVSGEAGELLDAVKKWVIYQKPLDLQNVMEELGDLEFYMEGMRQCVGLTREEVIEHNTKKLEVRYGEKYSNQAAITRKDKD